MEINKSIGKNIFECRKQRGLTQEQLAHKLGKSVNSVQRYESGAVDIPVSILAEIAAALDVSINYLIGYKPSFIKLESIADVMAFLLELNRKDELRFEIELNKDDDGQKKVALTFDAASTSAVFNSVLYDMMEELKINREAFEEYWINYETYKLWENQAVLKHGTAFLHDKEQEQISDEELVKRRNALFDKKLNEMRKGKFE